MSSSRCIYFVEGACEHQLIQALKESPCRLIPGKIKVFNPVQRILPKSQILAIQPGTTVIFVFDTDVLFTDYLKKNIELLQKFCEKIEVVFLAQVLNLEDELVRCTDVKVVSELTKSSGTNKFKSDFCRMKIKECRDMLERHHLDVARLWTKEPPNVFQFTTGNSERVKMK